MLSNRLSNAATERALDGAARQISDRQRADGIVEDSCGDGNFIRTALTCAFWKIQAAWLVPWRREVCPSAARSGAEL